MESYLKQFVDDDVQEDYKMLADVLAAQGIVDPVDLGFVSESMVMLDGTLCTLSAPTRALLCRAASAQRNRTAARVGSLLLAAARKVGHAVQGKHDPSSASSVQGDASLPGRRGVLRPREPSPPGKGASGFVPPGAAPKSGRHGCLRARKPMPPGSGTGLANFTPPGSAELSIAA